MKNLGTVLIGLVSTACLINACSSAPEEALYRCDPNVIFPDARCIAHDAGADGDAEPTKEPMGVDDLGLDPDKWRPCGEGFCAPELSGQSALVWEKVPVSLYIGSNDGTPLACPENLTEVGRLYDELVAPPAACEACTCETSKGECSQPPDKIEIRAGTCAESGVPFSPFDGPPNWTGTCSSEGGCPRVRCAETSPVRSQFGLRRCLHQKATRACRRH